MSSEITFNCCALSKILLHAARYPHAAVNGVILASSADHNSSNLVVVDAVPLFHQQLGLAPMMEIALTQVEQRYKSDGLVIAGYYQANELLKDNMPDFVATKMAEKIAENNNDAYLIMVDNRRLGLNLDTIPIIVSQLTSDAKWKSQDKSTIHVEKGSLELISQLLQRRVQHDVFDFDNHLDDLICDWTNPQINRLVATFSDADE